MTLIMKETATLSPMGSETTQEAAERYLVEWRKARDHHDRILRRCIPAGRLEPDHSIRYPLQKITERTVQEIDQAYMAEQEAYRRWKDSLQAWQLTRSRFSTADSK